MFIERRDIERRDGWERGQWRERDTETDREGKKVNNQELQRILIQLITRVSTAYCQTKFTFQNETQGKHQEHLFHLKGVSVQMYFKKLILQNMCWPIYLENIYRNGNISCLIKIEGSYKEHITKKMLEYFSFSTIWPM